MVLFIKLLANSYWLNAEPWMDAELEMQKLQKDTSFLPIVSINSQKMRILKNLFYSFGVDGAWG